MTENTTYEVWLDPLGRPAHLIPLGFPCQADDEDPWFAEDPGQLPPYTYELRNVANPRLALRLTVCAYEPWTSYDAIFDVLVGDGWTPPPPTDAELATCEHGLSALLCAGPGHYPKDDDR